MQYKHLGRCGLKVSRLALGTMRFTTDAEAFAIMDLAMESGINLLDTALSYHSESIVGRWLGLGGGRRDKMIVATKVYAGFGNGPNDIGLSALNIRQSCEKSLRQLQTDRIDLYQMHERDLKTPWEEVWQAMDQLVREGKILYCGTSNCHGWNIAQGQALAVSRHMLGLASHQSSYSLNNRFSEWEILPAAKAYGLGILIHTPLAQGLLAGFESHSGELRASKGAVHNAALERYRPQLEAYEKLCHGLGENPANVALAWIMHHPDVTAPLVGSRTVLQLENALRSVEIKLSRETLVQLNEIWPGPAGVEA